MRLIQRINRYSHIIFSELRAEELHDESGTGLKLEI